LVEDLLAKPRLDRATEDKINRATKHILQEKLQIHVTVKRGSLEFDDKVKIARFDGISNRDRSKQTQAPNTERANSIR